MRYGERRHDRQSERSEPVQERREGLGEFMTVEDVADMLRINKSTVYRMAKAGKIPATRVGRQWRFRLSALEDFLDAGGDGAFSERDEDESEHKRAVNW